MRKLLLEAPYQMHMVDAPIPEPAADEVRVRICKIGICGSDPTIYKGLHPYVTYPMVPGHELSGVIDAVGSHVDASRIGQRVTIIPHQVCGHCEACKHEIYNFCEELKCTGAEADGGMCDYFCIDAVSKAARLLEEQYDAFTVSQARDVLGTTRKYALPLLGEMDRRGITVREGEGRRFRSAVSCGECG